MRLNFRTGTEGLPVSSISCDRALRSGIRVPETVMSMGSNITDGIKPYATRRSL